MWWMSRSWHSNIVRLIFPLHGNKVVSFWIWPSPKICQCNQLFLFSQKTWPKDYRGEQKPTVSSARGRSRTSEDIHTGRSNWSSLFGGSRPQSASLVEKSSSRSGKGVIHHVCFLSAGCWKMLFLMLERTIWWMECSNYALIINLTVTQNIISISTSYHKSDVPFISIHWLISFQFRWWLI